MARRLDDQLPFISIWSPNLLEKLVCFMLSDIIMGCTRRMEQENIMWVVELNIAGYRFTREVADLPRTSLKSVRFHPRSMHWRLPQLRHERAA